MDGSLRASRIFEPPNPRAFHIYLPNLHWIAFELAERHDDAKGALRQLRAVHDHLASHLGPATFSWHPNYKLRNLPGIFWERDRVVVAIGPKYGGLHLSVSVKHTSEDHRHLQREAERIRAIEGDGRRIDHVAWPDDA